MSNPEPKNSHKTNTQSKPNKKVGLELSIGDITKKVKLATVDKISFCIVDKDGGKINEIVEVIEVFPSSGDTRELLTLVKEDGKWKLYYTAGAISNVESMSAIKFFHDISLTTLLKH